MRKVVHVFKLKDIDDYKADAQYYTIHQLRDYGIEIHEIWTKYRNLNDPAPTLEEITTNDEKLIEFFEGFNYELEVVAMVTMDDFLQKTLTRI